MIKFSERLKELRMERAMTQTDVAKATGISQNTIAQWENQKRTPNAISIVTLAKFFEVTTDYLLGVEDSIFQ